MNPSAWTPQSVLTTVLVSLLGGGVGISIIGFIVMYFLRGVWEKVGIGAIGAAITAHNAKPENIKVFKETVKEIIENEIRRDDGLIAKEIRTQVDEIETRLINAIEGLRIDNEFKDHVLNQLGEIRGTVRTLLHASGIPETPPPPPPGTGGSDLTGRHRSRT